MGPIGIHDSDVGVVSLSVPNWPVLVCESRACTGCTEIEKDMDLIGWRIDRKREAINKIEVAKDATFGLSATWCGGSARG